MSFVTRRALAAAVPPPVAVPPAVSIAVSPVTQTEAPGVAKTFVLTATRAPQAGRPGTDLAVASSLPWSAGGRALAGATPFDLGEFSGGYSGNLAFLPGATVAVASVTIQPDAVAQGTRAGRFTVGAPVGCVVPGATTADFALLDDDVVVVAPPPSGPAPTALYLRNEPYAGALGEAPAMQAATRAFYRVAVTAGELRRMVTSGLSGIHPIGALGPGTWHEEEDDNQERAELYIHPEPTAATPGFTVVMYPKGGLAPDGPPVGYVSLASLPADDHAPVWLAFRIDPSNAASGLRIRASANGAPLMAVTKPCGGALATGANAGRVYVGNGFARHGRSPCNFGVLAVEFGNGVLTDAEESAPVAADATGQRFGYVLDGRPFGTTATVPCVTAGRPALVVRGGLVGATPPGAPVTLELDAGGAAGVHVGVLRRFFAVVRDAHGHALRRTDWQWTLGPGVTGTLTPDGAHATLTAAAAGGATLTVSAGGLSATCQLTAAAAPSLTAALARVATLPTVDESIGRRGVPFQAYHAQDVRGMLRGGVYTDPASGRRVMKITDGRNSDLCALDYANGGPYVSHPDAQGWRYVAYFAEYQREITRCKLVPGEAPQIEDPWRWGDVMPRPYNDICGRWSTRTDEPHIFYFACPQGPGGFGVHRFNAATKQLEAGGPMSTPSRFFPSMATDASCVQFCMSSDGLKFGWSTLGQVNGWWDTTTDTYRQLDRGRVDHNESWLSPEGTHWKVEMGPPSRQTILARTPSEFRQEVSYGENTHVSMSDDGLSPWGSSDEGGYVDWNTGTRPNFPKPRTSVDWIFPSYTTAQWRQPGVPVAQRWVLQHGDYEMRALQEVEITSAWVQQGDGSWKASWQDRAYSGHEVPLVGYMVEHYGTWADPEGSPLREDFRARLDPVASQAALVNGTIYTNRVNGYSVFVKMPDGGNPTGRIRIGTPSASYMGINLRTFDMATVKQVAHHFNVNPAWPDYRPDGSRVEGSSPYSYVRRPFASHSQDGRVVPFNSNMGLRNGPLHVFLVEI